MSNKPRNRPKRKKNKTMSTELEVLRGMYTDAVVGAQGVERQRAEIASVLMALVDSLGGKVLISKKFLDVKYTPETGIKFDADEEGLNLVLTRGDEDEATEDAT